MKIEKTLTAIILLLFLSLNSGCSSTKDCNFPPTTEDDDKQTEIDINKKDIIPMLERVARWQMNNFTYSKTGNLHDYGIDAWTNGVLYLGFSEMAKMIDDNTKYYDWLNNIGNENKWVIPANFKNSAAYSLYHADELCIGQFYLNMYEKYKKNTMLQSTKERLDWIINNPPKEDMAYKNKQAWTWCDALFMAPPVYIHMTSITKDDKYIKFMDEQFKKTYNHLYDKEEELFYRDDSYFGKSEQNGEKIFWGRGNGWVIAGIVNILKYLPKDSQYRSFYEELYKKFSKRLIDFQDENGFWHASLLDPESYPSPETSATALITYGLTYGVNEGLLSREEFIPTITKGWKALNSAITFDGKLGWVQPIGADPKKVTKDMTAVYGVGAFMLAGTEIYKLVN